MVCCDYNESRDIEFVHNVRLHPRLILQLADSRAGLFLTFKPVIRQLTDSCFSGCRKPAWLSYCVPTTFYFASYIYYPYKYHIGGL